MRNKHIFQSTAKIFFTRQWGKTKFFQSKINLEGTPPPSSINRHFPRLLQEGQRIKFCRLQDPGQKPLGKCLGPLLINSSNGCPLARQLTFDNMLLRGLGVYRSGNRLGCDDVQDLRSLCHVTAQRFDYYAKRAPFVTHRQQRLERMPARKAQRSRCNVHSPEKSQGSRRWLLIRI